MNSDGVMQPDASAGTGDPHPAPRPDRRGPFGGLVSQHDDCEAIGSVLNGSYKTRWHTKRAGAMWVLGSLTGFSASLALGAASLFAAVVALGFAVATAMVYRIERKQRRLRGLALSPRVPR